MAFTEEDRQQLIDFYKEHPMLWNSNLKEYRNRELRRVNLERLAEQLNLRYSVEKIQQEWHNLMTYFDRERMRIEGSKKSGAGLDDVYQTSWPYYGSMEFCMDKSLPDDAVSTLNHIAPVPKKKKSKNDYEEKKAKLWEVLSERLTESTSNINGNTWQNAWQQGFQTGFQQAWQQCSQMLMQQQIQPFATTSMDIQGMQPSFRPNFFGNTSVSSSSTGRTNNPFMQIQPEPNCSQQFQTPPMHRARSRYHTPPSPHQPPPQHQPPMTPRSRPGKANTANTNMCAECGRVTKYMCVNCPKYVCNVCSTPADSLECENYTEEGEIRRVGYCMDCPDD
jgi:hypothetical protein